MTLDPREPALPVPADAGKRLPTMVAGSSPGPVRLWAPRPAKIRREAAGWGAALVASGAGLYLMRSAVNWVVGPALVLIGIVGLGLAAAILLSIVANRLIALPALWRPTYITDDETGFGVTTWLKSAAVPWSEILAYARYDLLASVLLYTRSGKVIYVNTSGYTRRDVDEFCSRVAERADLTVEDRTRWRQLLFWGMYHCRLREGYRLTGSDEVVPAPIARPAALPEVSPPVVARTEAARPELPWDELPPAGPPADGQDSNVRSDDR